MKHVGFILVWGSLIVLGLHLYASTLPQPSDCYAINGHCE